MTLGERIVQLQEKTQRLSDLLKEPEPGLSTWVLAVARALDDLAEHSPSYFKTKEF